MKRRNVIKTMTIGAILPTIFGAKQAMANLGIKLENPPKKQVLMKVGCQSGGTTIENLEF